MRTAIMVAGILLVAPLAVLADSAPVLKPDVRVAFDSVDRNADQRISKTEAGPHKNLIDRFAYIDTNGDGFISREELYASLTASTAQ